MQGRCLILAGAMWAAVPAYAAGDAFFSLANTDFVVLLAFILFGAILVYFKVPQLLGGLLDKRADRIRSELDEAKALREEAQTLLASYERKQAEVQEQADRIVATARKEAEAAAEQAKKDLELSIERRLQAAEDQIASAEAEAVRSVRDRAIAVAGAAAADVLQTQYTGDAASAVIDRAIETVGQKLN